MRKSPIRTVKTKTSGSALRSDPSRTATLRRLFEEQVTKRFKQLKKSIVQLVAVEDCFGLRDIPIENFNPSQPRDYRGRWSSGGGGSTGKVKQTETEAFKKWFGNSKVVDENGKPLVVYHGTGREFDQFKEGTVNAWSDALGFDTYFFGEDKATPSTYAAQFKEGKLMEVHLSIQNPLEIDAKGGEWFDALGEAIDKISTYRTPQEKSALDVRSKFKVKWEYELDYEPQLIPEKDYLEFSSAMKSVEQHIMSNRDLYKNAKRQPHEYDGIIIKNVLDMTSADVSDDIDSYSPFTTVYVAFKPTQIKSATGNKGTFDPNDPVITNEIIANKRYKFLRTPQQVEAFRRWLIEQTNGVVLDDIESDSAKQAFWAEYVIEGYKKGMGRAFDDIHNGYAAKFAQDGSTDDFYDGSKFEFLKSSFGRPETVEKIQLLAGRVFTDLKGVTDSMSAAMSRALVDGLSQGAGPMEVADELVKQADLSESRAKMVARTELMRAHNEGALDAMEELGVEEIGVMVEWSTGGHNVCPLCKALKGVILTTKEARGMFPRHPNCKCVPIPANVGESTEGQKRSKTAIERAVTRSIDKERPKTFYRSIEAQRKRSTWQGATKKVSKKRPKSILDGEV